jgi:flagellar protein FlaG
MNDLRVNGSVSPPVFPNARSPLPAEESKVVAEPAPAVAVKSASSKPADSKPQLTPESGMKEAKRLSEELQRRVGGPDSQLQFTVDESTGESVIKVMDKATKEVIRQIPSKEMLEIAQALDRFQESFLVNSKA